MESLNKTRRMLLKGALAGSALVAAPAVLRTKAFANEPIKVGVLFDVTGALGILGVACVNTTKLIAEQINASGGLLGRPVELVIADSASNEAMGVSVARRMVQRDKVDVVIGALTSAMRNAVKPVITGSNTVWLYPSLYEGGECTPNLFCTGPTPAQQCDVYIPWLIQNGGKKFALTGSNYNWPKTLFDYARKVIADNGAEVVYEEYFPFDQMDFASSVQQLTSSGANVAFNIISPPGGGVFFKQLHEARFRENGGLLSSIYYDENALLMNQPEEIEGMTSTLDYYLALAKDDPGSAAIQTAYDEKFPGEFKFTAGTQATGTYRAFKLWEAAVNEAKSLETEAVAAALDHAELQAGPGGPCRIVPGKRHTAMNMYIAQSKQGVFEVVHKSPEQVDPGEC